MRISALVNIADYVAYINDKIIYVEQTVYLNLQSLFERASDPAWFKHTDSLTSKAKETSNVTSKPMSAHSKRLKRSPVKINFTKETK